MGARQVSEQRWIYQWVPAAKARTHGVRFTGDNNYINFRFLPGVREK